LLGPGLGDVDHRIGAFVADDALGSVSRAVAKPTAAATNGPRNTKGGKKIESEPHLLFLWGAPRETASQKRLSLLADGWNTVKTPHWKVVQTS
jgi:hypothetical protein